MKYLKTVRDGIVMYCTACAENRYVWIGVEDGEELTCCGTCQRILKRVTVL